LEINQELLYELVSLTNSKAELKKEQTSAESGDQKSDVDFAEEEKLNTADYTHCIRRLHTNLAYMAVLADRKSVQAPPNPAYLMPPPLNLKLKLRVPKTAPGAPDGATELPPDPNSDREERDQLLKDLYKRLQALFPGVDPRKEPPPQPPNARPGGQQMNPGMMKPQNGQMNMGMQSNGSPGPGPQLQKTPQMINIAAPSMPLPGA